MGDGTTSVVVLAGELLREAEKLVSQKIHPMTIISGVTSSLTTLTMLHEALFAYQHWSHVAESSGNCHVLVVNSESHEEMCFGVERRPIAIQQLANRFICKAISRASLHQPGCNGAGYREACELAYKRLEEVSINNSANVKAFRQVWSASPVYQLP